MIIDHPPLNLLDKPLITDLRRLADVARVDDTLRVVVFESADPEFFSAHGDARFVSEDGLFASLGRPGDAPLNPMQALHENLRTLPQVTIGKLAGLARGGGSELLMSLDLRFAALESARIAQFETALGILPGGGGTQYLTRLVGRARALEIILGGALFNARDAERFGLVNRAMPGDVLDRFVDGLADRIGTLSADVVGGVKRAVDTALSGDIPAGLAVENDELGKLFTAKATDRTLHLLDRGYQTREVERDLESFFAADHRNN